MLRGSGNSNYNFSPSIFNERNSASSSMHNNVSSSIENLMLGRGPNGMVYNMFRDKLKEQLNVVDSECEDNNDNGIHIDKQIRENDEDGNGGNGDSEGDDDGDKHELSFSMFSDVVEEIASNHNGNSCNKGDDINDNNNSNNNMPIQHRMNMNLRKHIHININASNNNKHSENGMSVNKDNNDNDNDNDNNKENAIDNNINNNNEQQQPQQNIILPNQIPINSNTNINNIYQNILYKHSHLPYPPPTPLNNNPLFFPNPPPPFLPLNLPPLPPNPPTPQTLPHYFFLLVSHLPTFSYYPFPQLSPTPNPTFTSLPKKPKKAKRLDQSTYQSLPITSLLPNFYSLCTDQGGCRYIQHLIESNPYPTITALYPSLIENFFPITLDPFGNYLVQRVFPYLNETQLFQVITLITPHIYDIGINPQGTRVIQQLITCLSSTVLIEYFLRTILPYIIAFLKDLNGTHIVQKFAKDYPAYSQYIDIIIIENGATLAMNRHGCCVVQNYFTLYSGELLERFVKKLIANCLMLIIDQFGNYVIQSILLMKNVVYGNEITEKIIENVCYYAKHKYSSNVVEKCFEYCDGLTRQKLICSLIKSEVIGELMFDEHGNYIIQKALACSDAETQKIILRAVLPQFTKLKELHFGERIISRLSKTYAGIIEGIKGEKGGKKNSNGDGNSGHKGSNKGSGKKNKSKNNNNNNRTNQGSPPGKSKKDY